MNPVSAFCISVLMYLGGSFMTIFANIYSWHFPPIFIEGIEILAKTGVVLTAVIAALNYFGIKWNPFKKKKGGKRG